MKYIIATLVGGHKLYSMHQFFKHIGFLTQKPEEIWISCTKEIFDECVKANRQLFPLRHIHGPNDTGNDEIHSTTSAREALRQAIRVSDYEWTMWLDNDMLVPPNMVDEADKLLSETPNLQWIHSYHPCRQDGGKSTRHGLGSCFIHRELMNVPFVMATVNRKNLGDDYLWIHWIQLFIKLGWVKSISGKLFDVKHFREDGMIIEWQNT